MLGEILQYAPVLCDTERESSLKRGIEQASKALLTRQRPDGHWVFELEADATMPADHVLLWHYLDEIDVGREQLMGAYLRAGRTAHGGWPLFHGGEFDLSVSVKAYFALKAIGDRPEMPHMREAREAVLAHGGAERSNVFARTMLALFGEVPWHAVPVMPVEIMNLPRWSPFHLDKISYWSRTLIVPLLVLMALKPRARNPRAVHVPELFVTPPFEVRNWFRKPAQSGWTRLLIELDHILRRAEPLLPKAPRQRAITKAVDFVVERLNGEDGLGAILPPIAHSVMMFDALGYPSDHPHAATARRAMEKLVVAKDGRAYAQSCVSPVWDTALACHALLETEEEPARAAARDALDWLEKRQILDVRGDWARQRPALAPGGWAFQYANPHYPDLDDTAVVVMAMDRLDRRRFARSIEAATAWVEGMQSRDGGWAAFDADNTHHELNHIPFADHGALIDPPTADVTARCISMLAQLGGRRDNAALDAGLRWLMAAQEADGSWFGRWGTNYIYGTWSALCALESAGIAHTTPAVRRAVAWLLQRQRADGGWGEDARSYWPGAPHGEAAMSTPSQTAWALLGLMAAGKVQSEAVARGVGYLLATQSTDGSWEEEPYTAVGFPRVFYLRYHGYRLLFPLWALARYRKLTGANHITDGQEFLSRPSSR